MSGQKQYGLILNPFKKAPLKFVKPSVFDGSSDEEDSGKVGVNRTLQKEATRQKDNKQVQQAIAQAIAEDPTLYEYDEVYDKIEADRKKTMAAKLGMGKNKPKYITSLKKAASQRQREYERVIERKAHKERETEGEEFTEKDAFVTSSYRKKMEELQEDEMKLKQQEEFDEKHGIHKQKDLSKFYSNLLKKNISMGAYNVTASSSKPAEERSKDASEPSTVVKSTSDQVEEGRTDGEKVDETEQDDEKVAANVVRREIVDEETTIDEENEAGGRSETEVEDRTLPNNSTDKMADGDDISISTAVEEVKKKRGEKRNTEETVMAARERYLARKRMKQET